MEWTRVRSNNIRMVGYDPETKTLGVRFASGTVYHYDDVPSDLHKKLLDAKSHGAFLHTHIKPHHVATKQEKQEKQDES